MFSPFESFTVFEIINVFTFFLSSFSLLFLVYFYLFFKFQKYIQNETQANTRLLNFVGNLILFVFNLHINQTVFKSLRKLFPISLTVFLFVFLGNIVGLIPNAFSSTGHIGLTFFLAITIFLAWIILGLLKLKLNFFALFIPHNCPAWLFPLMIVIELLSFFIRPFSLAIRLFANILSGHILLHLIHDTHLHVRDIEKNGYLPLIPSTFSLPVILAEVLVNILEIGVGCLQAYIFVILTCIYLEEIVHPRSFRHS